MSAAGGKPAEDPQRSPPAQVDPPASAASAPAGGAAAGEDDDRPGFFTPGANSKQSSTDASSNNNNDGVSKKIFDNAAEEEEGVVMTVVKVGSPGSAPYNNSDSPDSASGAAAAAATAENSSVDDLPSTAAQKKNSSLSGGDGAAAPPAASSSSSAIDIPSKNKPSSSSASSVPSAAPASSSSASAPANNNNVTTLNNYALSQSNYNNSNSVNSPPASSAGAAAAGTLTIRSATPDRGAEDDRGCIYGNLCLESTHDPNDNSWNRYPARRHGWHRPLHVRQIAAWATKLVLIIFYASFVGWPLEEYRLSTESRDASTHISVAVNLLIAILMFVVVALALVVTLVDPGPDDVVPTGAYRNLQLAATVSAARRRRPAADASRRGGGRSRSPSPAPGPRARHNAGDADSQDREGSLVLDSNSVHSAGGIGLNPEESWSPLKRLAGSNAIGVAPSMYCHFCRRDVHASCKHCKSCNRCVRDFDHHCLSKPHMELLTDKGWVDYAAAKAAYEADGLVVAGYNIDAKQIVYERPSHFIDKHGAPSDGMYEISADDDDIKLYVSGEHELLVHDSSNMSSPKDGKRRDFKKVTPKQLLAGTWPNKLARASHGQDDPIELLSADDIAAPPTIKQKHIKKVDGYADGVWCVSMPSGNIVVRCKPTEENGFAESRPMIVGNCKWLNVCVGQHNYIFFFWYLAALSTLSLVVCAMCIAVLVQLHPSSRPDMPVGMYAMAAVTLALTVPIVVAISNLFGYHIWLSCKGMTTFEDLLRKAAEKQKQEDEKQEDKRL